MLLGTERTFPLNSLGPLISTHHHYLEVHQPESGLACSADGPDRVKLSPFLQWEKKEARSEEREGSGAPKCQDPLFGLFVKVKLSVG